MSDSNKIIKRLDMLEALAISMAEEATQLKRELGVVSTSPVRKGRYAAAAAKVIANRNKTISNRKAGATNTSSR